MARSEMVPGGVWMVRSADQSPVYVANPDTIQHLLTGGGWWIVDDPREDPDGVALEETAAEESIAEASEEETKPARSAKKREKV